jgi:hypothetical protein
MKRRLVLGLIIGGLGILLIGVTYWVSLLLINQHPAFIPNADKRIAMFKSLTHNPRQGGRWTPRQGENWIF